MMTQDALRFYKSHGVYDNFGGVVLDREEGKRIAKALGNGKAVILQNHGLLTVSEPILRFVASITFEVFDFKTFILRYLANSVLLRSGNLWTRRPSGS